MRSMSDQIKEKWELLYYAQVMAMLDFVKSGGKELCGVTPEQAGRIMAVLAKYSYMDAHEYGDGPDLAPETTVRVSVFAHEMTDISTLWGFMLAGGLPGFTPPFDLNNEYARTMVQKTEDYIKAQEEKQAACLQAIRDYVSECEAAGSKPVKKRVAEQTGFSYDYVRGVWQLFDEERRGG